MKNIWHIRPVDMCIYIDNHIYEKYDEELVFGYLQWLFYSLAHKKKYFKDYSDYDGYAIYGATQTYMRLINPKQFLEENDPKKLPKIKSVLNFIKKIMYPLRVNYQKSVFNDVLKIEENCEYNGIDMLHSVTEGLQSSMGTNSLLAADVELYLSRVTAVIKNCVLATPYSSDPLITHNLYLSCLLTFLRGITLSNVNQERLKHFSEQKVRVLSQATVDKIYKEEQESAPVVWRLPKSYLPLINVLYAKIKQCVAQDIKGLVTDYQISDDVMQTILLTGEQEGEDDT